MAHRHTLERQFSGWLQVSTASQSSPHLSVASEKLQAWKKKVLEMDRSIHSSRQIERAQRDHHTLAMPPTNGPGRWMAPGRTLLTNNRDPTRKSGLCGPAVQMLRSFLCADRPINTDEARSLWRAVMHEASLGTCLDNYRLRPGPLNGV